MERIRDFAAIDFETANGQRTSVCSVGVVVVRGGRPSESIYRLIRPYPNYYSAFTTAIHGLTRSDTENAPSFPDVWGEIAPRIEGSWRITRPSTRGVCGLSTPITDYPIPTTVSCVR